MSGLKTKATKQDPHKFVSSIEDDQRREDSVRLLRLVPLWTNLQPEMWGKDIVGYGKDSYKTADGKEHEWMVFGFSPRKQAMTLYLMSGFGGYDKLLDKLGPHKIGKSCLYIKKLDDVDENILEKIIKKSVESISKRGLMNDYIC